MLKMGSLARPEQSYQAPVPGEPLHQGSDAKHTLTYTPAEISALLARGCCCNTTCGVTWSCSKGWGPISRETPADEASDGQARCTEQLPAWEALLHEILLIFCTFCSFSNICAKAVQTDVRVGELVENQ